VTLSDANRGAIRDMIPFAAQLGIELLDAEPELVRGRLAWAPERTTTADVMHGGAIMALADTCGGVCAFLCAVRIGAVTATTRPLRKGHIVIVLETEIARDDGKLAAKMTQTQIYHYA
jgi:1,4-dihydroxy-2-naphthoyl-CoA hydrolase